MFSEEDFEPIRPYHDKEINAALRRITASPLFDKVVGYLFPEKNNNYLKDDLMRMDSAIEFQQKFMYPVVQEILRKSSAGLTSEGFMHLKPGIPYLFVSNHRDIVLDSAMLQTLLLDHGHETSEITFGSNLMTTQFIIDFGKINRMFVVNRDGNGRELFKNSQLLSAYIRHTITNKKTSAWIAQRNGRTKDGHDKTEPALLKMFSISGGKNFIQSVRDLNIVPIAVSYEFEPCCAMKVKEQGTISRGIAYRKEPGEDISSILTGITQWKGRIHLALGRPVNLYLDETDQPGNGNDKINRLADLIDTEIYNNYMLWPNNYIAYDLHHKTEQYSHKYTKADAERFADHMQNEMAAIDMEEDVKKDIFLRMYANPVKNARIRISHA